MDVVVRNLHALSVTCVYSMLMNRAAVGPARGATGALGEKKHVS